MNIYDPIVDYSIEETAEFFKILDQEFEKTEHYDPKFFFYRSFSSEFESRLKKEPELDHLKDMVSQLEIIVRDLKGYMKSSTYLLTLLLSTELKDIPLHINCEFYAEIAVIKWRLKLGR